MSQRTNLATIAEAIIGRFDILSAARDRALTEGRQIIRFSANTVRAVHRGELTEARSLLSEAETLLRALNEHLSPYPSIYWAGYVQDAMKEFAEASVTLADRRRRDHSSSAKSARRRCAVPQRACRGCQRAPARGARSAAGRRTRSRRVPPRGHGRDLRRPHHRRLPRRDHRRPPADHRPTPRRPGTHPRRPHDYAHAKAT